MEGSSDGAAPLERSASAQYHRDGYLVISGVLTQDHVASCIEALSRLAGDSALTAARSNEGVPFVALEATADPAAGAAESRVDLVRKLGNFTDAEPALLRAAMSARLHGHLDGILGPDRVLLQEMALVKPPRIGGEKRWHQDAAYFRVSDPDRVFGVWIALDPATEENGCMEIIPGSHLRGPVPHVPDPDINLCTIEPAHLRLAGRVRLTMDPGDALIFHSLVHHYTAANRSDRRRRALQFHYHQQGVRWTSLAEHGTLYHDADGAYAGCTVPKGAPLVDESSYRPSRLRPVVPIP